MRTLQASRHISMRIAKASPAEAMELYYSTLLGKDYNEQVRSCVCAAAQLAHV